MLNNRGLKKLTYWWPW